MNNHFTDDNEIKDKDSVYVIADIGIITGYEDGSYKPNKILTRGAMAKVFCSLVIGPTAASCLILRNSAAGCVEPWKDVPITNTFAPYISFFKQCLDLDENEQSKEWIEELLSSTHFDPSGALTKQVALQWLNVAVTSYFSQNAHPEYRGESEESATREWLAVRLVPAIPFISPLKYELLKFLLKNEYDVNCRLQNITLYKLNAAYEKFYSSKKKTKNKFKSGYKYTSLSRLKSMIDESKENEKLKTPENAEDRGYGKFPFSFDLHMSNAEFFNDPDEGNLLLKTFKPERVPNTDSSDRLEPRQEHFACLIHTKAEYLPMWVNYGDGGKGCRIEFEIKSHPKNLLFFKVEYIRSTPNGPAKTLVDEVTDIVNTYTGEIDVVYNWAKYLLRKAGYFYKSSYYSYENEIRIFPNMTPATKVEMYEKPYGDEIFPRTYMRANEPLKVKSITLGPKCKNPEQIAVALHNLGIETVYRSNIHFQ